MQKLCQLFISNSFFENHENKSLQALREKYPYSEFFWFVFSRIWTEYTEYLSQNAKKYGPEKLRIRTLFMQYYPYRPESKPTFL